MIPLGLLVSPFARFRYPNKYEISVHLATSAVGILSPIASVVAAFALYFMVVYCRKLHFAMKEKRRVKRTPEPGDITTELGTAPGEASSGP